MNCHHMNHITFTDGRQSFCPACHTEETVDMLNKGGYQKALEDVKKMVEGMKWWYAPLRNHERGCETCQTICDCPHQSWNEALCTILSKLDEMK